MRWIAALTMVVAWLFFQPVSEQSVYGQESTPPATNPDSQDPFERSTSSEYVPDMQEPASPSSLVRNNAAERAAQRRQRIASYKWLGISRLRPPAEVTPWMGTSNYSPVFSSWTSTYSASNYYPSRPRVVYIYPVQ